MRKWIPLFILVFGFLLLTCTSCTPKSSSTSTSCTPTNTDGAETIFIDGSTFMMGSLSTDVGAESDEQPQHEVNLGCYNIYKKEVTNAMYAKCVASGSCFPVQPRENTPTAHVNDPLFSEYPVVGVDYNMATEYCSWAGARLTTEAEWEYASRGNKLFTYPWGNNDPTCSLANSKGCFNPEDTEKVGSLTAGNSPVKVMDLAGNAWEWVFDWYGANYYQNSPSNNPTGPINGFWKVVRGGGYNSIPSFLRTANRHAGDPYEAYYNVGFRCATGAFTLTEGYQQPNQDLHRIPIDGPVDDGDPNNPGNPSLNTGILPIGCPDGNGNLHIFLEVSSPDTPQMGSFYLNGEVFGCNWDAGNHWYECVGQAPQTNDPTYSITYCFHVGDVDQCMMNVQVPKPQNCDGSQTPTVQNIQVSCPNEGNIKVVFHFEPAVTWDLAQIDGGVDMDCNYLDPLDYQCTAPDILTNGKYAFHLHGTGVNDNADYTWYSYAPPNPDCPQGNKDFQGILYPYCDGNNPGVQMEYVTSLSGDPMLNVGGYHVSLTPVGPGVYKGPVNPIYQGMSVDYSMGISPDLLVFGMVDVPKCPADFSGILYPSCGPNGPEVQMEYVTNLSGDPMLNVGGYHVSLTPVGPGVYKGPVNPIYQGMWVDYSMGISPDLLSFGMVNVPQCPADFSGILYPSCDGTNPSVQMEYVTSLSGDPMLNVGGYHVSLTPVGPGVYKGPVNPIYQGMSVDYSMGISPNLLSFGMVDVPQCTLPTSCACRFLGSDCLTTTTFGFSIQTCANNPIALVAQSVTATDGVNTYQCQLTNQVGVAYCGGTIPNTSGPLTVCYVQQGSQDQHCCVIDNFASTIPSCANFNPNPGEPGKPPCSSYSPASCPKDRCHVATTSGQCIKN